MFGKIKKTGPFRRPIIKTNKMKKLSTAAKLGKLTEKIQMISLVLILLYFVGRIFVSAFFNI